MIKSGKGSNNQTQPLTVSDPDPSPDPDPVEDNGMPCSLYVDHENSPVHVANGRAFMGTTIHGNKIPSNQARVTVERIVRGQGGTPVPNPTDEVRLLAQAKGHFILWPKRLIAKPMVKKTAAKKDTTSASSDPVLLPLPGDVALMYSSLEVLHSMVPNMDKPVTFKMPLGVVGSDITYDFTIDKRDLVQFLNFEELDIAFMQLAIL